MSTLEILDRLCAVLEEQARIIHEQLLFIENCKTVDDAAKQHFADLREPVDTELGFLEAELRVDLRTACGKEGRNE